MVALLILAFGAYFRALHRQRGVGLLQERAHPGRRPARRLAQYAILTFVVLIALDQVNVGGTSSARPSSS